MRMVRKHKSMQELEEKIEKHDTLNPKLFNEDDTLKEEVREKILQIVNAYVEDLEQDSIKLIIKDIVLIGSNASYNYTDKSDLDIHIIADTASLHCPDNLYPILYSAYRSLFNKKFDIDFYGIPVELYVETEDIATVSNGIYSVKEDEWIKVPEPTAIPEFDQKAFNKEYKVWEQKCKRLLAKLDAVSLDEAQALENEIIELINDIYTLRKDALKNNGEYATGNLVFKELRNVGLLDELKQGKNKMEAKSLSLESLKEQLDERKRHQYMIKIMQTIHIQPIIQSNNYFFIYNVPESDVNYIISALKRLPFIKTVERGGAGKYDFSHINPVKLPQRLFTITGTIKED